jgi:3-methyladenine DNA glycosylase/8-oxoguanine DNA glycosylase
MRELSLRPAAPFLLAASAGPPEACRRFRGGVLDLTLRVGDGCAAARVWQRPDGTLGARLWADDLAAAHDRLCDVLRLRLDHRPFLQLAARDPLLRPLRSRMAGLRPLLLGSPEQALVRGIAGQLIRASEAYRIERRLVADVMPRDPRAGLREPPRAADLRAAHPARFQRAGLSPMRAAVLSRASRLDWARLAGEPTDRLEARLRSVPGIGVWTAAVILIRGFGRLERGLAGDLALIRLAGALLGRPADAEDSARLLEPYGEWAGLASIWLLQHPSGHSRGQVARPVRPPPAPATARG